VNLHDESKQTNEPIGIKIATTLQYPWNLLIDMEVYAAMPSYVTM
jgi:hypothetical protein